MGPPGLAPGPTPFLVTIPCTPSPADCPVAMIPTVAQHAFTAEDRELILRMKETPNIYHKLAASIAPTVYGHDEVKRGLLT